MNGSNIDGTEKCVVKDNSGIKGASWTPIKLQCSAVSGNSMQVWHLYWFDFYSLFSLMKTLSLNFLYRWILFSGRNKDTVTL